MTYHIFESQANLGFDPIAVWSGLYNTEIKDRNEV